MILKSKITVLVISFVSLIVAPIYFSADEEYCVTQEGIEQGYCADKEIEGEGGEPGIVVGWCEFADMSAPNEEGKKKCAGNAMEPIQQ